MKLRYYLRGLGIGILVTALIMGITGKNEQPLTDAEIKAKAATLGMVDAGSLSLTDVSGQASPSPSAPNDVRPESPSPGSDDIQSESPSPTPNDVQSESPSPASDDIQSESPSPSPDDVHPESPSPGSDDIQSESPSPTPDDGETEGSERVSEPVTDSVTLVVVNGDNSYTVSRRLEEAGLIEDAGEFDSFLVKNGYATRIRKGTYEIPMDADWTQIAETIT